VVLQKIKSEIEIFYFRFICVKGVGKLSLAIKKVIEFVFTKNRMKIQAIHNKVIITASDN
jgi:hypothetical protein